MRWIKLGWVAILSLAYIWFVVWYGGNGKPITEAEGRALLENFRAVHTDPAPGEASFLPNIEKMIPLDDGKEFYAVNLEQLKDGEAAREADAAYAKIVMPLLFKRASHPVFVSQRVGLMLGAYGEEVDRVAVVRYRSLRDMIEMASEPAMAKGGTYKFASLDHTEVFVTRPIISFMQVRLMLALLLLVIGFAGWKLLGLIERRLG